MEPLLGLTGTCSSHPGPPVAANLEDAHIHLAKVADSCRLYSGLLCRRRRRCTSGPFPSRRADSVYRPRLCPYVSPHPDTAESVLININDRHPDPNNKLEAGGSQRQPDLRMPSYPEAAVHPSPHPTSDSQRSGLRSVTSWSCAFQHLSRGPSPATAAYLPALYICRGLTFGFCSPRHRLYSVYLEKKASWFALT
jgi:hypothetical protein